MDFLIKIVNPYFLSNTTSPKERGRARPVKSNKFKQNADLDTIMTTRI